MADKKVQLKDSSNNLLFPRGRIDNIANASNVTITVPYLDGTGKIPAAYIPSAVDDVVELLNMASSAPSSASTGDKYFNSSTNKIYTATATDTWGTTGEDPSTDVIYVNKNNNKIYRWTGGNTPQMMEISPQITPVQTVGTPGSTASVPSESAVRSAISTASQAYVLPAASTASLGGIKVDGTVFTVSSSDTLEVVAITATSIDSIGSTDNGRVLTGAKFKSLVDAKLAGYQTTVSGSTGISVSSNTVSLASNYDIYWEELS